jgi:Ca2+-binding EF-hand superfamily protein
VYLNQRKSNNFYIYIFSLLTQNTDKYIPQADEVIALRIVEQYKKMFDFLDYKPVDDLLSPDELAEAFKDFGWPKNNPEISDDYEYAKAIVERYDGNNKNSLNFLEFCKFMEDQWNNADMIQEEKCNIGFLKSKDIFFRLFQWLDRNNDGYISPEDMIYGISRIMIRDVDMKEIQLTFAKYDTAKTGRLSKDNFLMAVINGDLDLTFKDELLTTTFIQ